ncbi:MAG TPA: hypothetical protein EYH22_00770 [Candidatus Nanopusillus sp.]|nr:hypothetical protein [Candidatus Nanopusillus sp.]
MIDYKYKFSELLTLNFDFGKLKFLNIINLNREELEIIRNWRNKDEIRKWMYTDHIITLEEHFN